MVRYGKLNCEWCEKEYIKKKINPNQKFCCGRCRERAKRYRKLNIRTELNLKERRRKKCAYCKKEFSIRQLNQRCCNSVCYERYYDRNIRSGKKARERSRKSYWKNRDKKLAKRYNITAEQYRDLTKKCYFCEFTEIVDCHHIVPFSRGGKHELSNYIGLCPNHHKLIHLKGYKLKQESDTEWKMIKPKTSKISNQLKLK